MKKIISVIGARPQFIKHAPMQMELQRYFNALTIHTGQHYDSNMSDVFFGELNIPPPDYMLDIEGTKLQGEQTAVMIREIEKVCLLEHPAAMILYGDTNSTLAAALVAVKMHIPIVHIESGLRSFNRTMPEEINRIIADQFSKLLFCPTKQAVENLKQEGIDHERVFLSGDVMCDALKMVEDRARCLVNNPYYFATLHRPYNTDRSERLKTILEELNKLDQPVIFSTHPRTMSRFDEYGISQADFLNIRFIGPVGYIESVSYQKYATAVLTDSGGIQKEAYMLQKKCVTIRSETEWVETLENGWNTLVFHKVDDIGNALQTVPGIYVDDLYGTGNAAQEIVKEIRENI
ncbi:MAG: UDP-N-acetylglucosamine 2-epimerase (non-hydrolyzing) [Mucilaginibacter polytrichastri]|nr:UDP-N-acetylglucosamine 2-epimerase (non-hydrolyzing) [Mucilaginibacter polytrichastri]